VSIDLLRRFVKLCYRDANAYVMKLEGPGIDIKLIIEVNRLEGLPGRIVRAELDELCKH